MVGTSRSDGVPTPQISQTSPLDSLDGVELENKWICVGLLLGFLHAGTRAQRSAPSCPATRRVCTAGWRASSHTLAMCLNAPVGVRTVGIINGIAPRVNIDHVRHIDNFSRWSCARAPLSTASSDSIPTHNNRTQHWPSQPRAGNLNTGNIDVEGGNPNFQNILLEATRVFPVVRHSQFHMSIALDRWLEQLGKIRSAWTPPIGSPSAIMVTRCDHYRSCVCALSHTWYQSSIVVQSRLTPSLAQKVRVEVNPYDVHRGRLFPRCDSVHQLCLTVLGGPIHTGRDGRELLRTRGYSGISTRISARTDRGVSNFSNTLLEMDRKCQTVIHTVVDHFRIKFRSLERWIWVRGRRKPPHWTPTAGDDHRGCCVIRDRLLDYSDAIELDLVSSVSGRMVSSPGRIFQNDPHVMQEVGSWCSCGICALAERMRGFSKALDGSLLAHNCTAEIAPWQELNLGVHLGDHSWGHFFSAIVTRFGTDTQAPYTHGMTRCYGRDLVALQGSARGSTNVIIDDVGQGWRQSNSMRFYCRLDHTTETWAYHYLVSIPSLSPPSW